MIPLKNPHSLLPNSASLIIVIISHSVTLSLSLLLPSIIPYV
jgi:hypothetical protein